MSGKQVWIILQRTLNTVRKEPTQIVTALRIIEREERADQFALTVRFPINFYSKNEVIDHFKMNSTKKIFIYF